MHKTPTDPQQHLVCNPSKVMRFIDAKSYGFFNYTVKARSILIFVNVHEFSLSLVYSTLDTNCNQICVEYT